MWKTQNMGEIIKATREYAKEITELRVAEYKQAKNFKLKNCDYLAWGETDDKSLVLIVKNSEKTIVSTMRCELHNSFSDLEKSLDNKPPLQHLIWPVAVTSRSATIKQEQSQGFNSLLRFYLLQEAKNSGATYAYSLVHSNSPRTKTMMDAGYEFYPAKKCPDFVTSDHQLNIAVIDLEKNFENALMILSKKAKPLFKEFPYHSKII